MANIKTMDETTNQIIYIVVRNDEIDEVFDSLWAAENHRSNLVKKWNITRIIAKTVNMI